MNFTLLFVAILWGINNPVVKSALQHFSPLAFNGLCFAIASVALCLIFLVQKQSIPRYGKDWGNVILIALLGTTLYQILFIFGIHLTRAGNTSLILAMVPIFVALLSQLTRNEKLSWEAWIGIFLSLGGVSLIILGDNSLEVNKNTFQGDMLILLGALMTAISLLLCTSLLKRYNAFSTAVMTCTLGGSLLFLVSIPSFFNQDWSLITGFDWMSLGYSALFPTALAQLILYSQLHKKGTTRVAIYNNIVPVVSLLVAWPLLKENPQYSQILGAIAIFAGTFITERKKS